MTRAVGDVKADSLMQRILPLGEDSGPAIELARWLTPQALIPLTFNGASTKFSGHAVIPVAGTTGTTG